MSSPFASRLEELAASYERARSDVRQTQDQLRTITATVKSDKGLLTVTVGAQGQITELRFNSRAYRSMSPGALATVLTETIEKARLAVTTRVGEIVGGSLPAGLSFDAVREGAVDWDAVLPQPTQSLDDLAGLASRVLATDRGDQALE
jgi:DNA-binding protein YbaB